MHRLPQWHQRPHHVNGDFHRPFTAEHHDGDDGTVRYLGIEVDGALEMAQQTEI